MKPLYAIFPLILSTGVALDAAAQTDWSQTVVTVCAEDAGWPPFSLLNSDPELPFRGFNADVLKAIFEGQGIPYRIVHRPWKRCLLDGMHGDVNIVLDAAKNPEREQNYLLTRPVYSLTPVIFFARSHTDAYPDAISTDKLMSLHLCGQSGYTYSNFTIDDTKVERVAEDLAKVLDLTRLDRCELGLARKEVLLTELKAYPQASDIGYQTIQNAQQEDFYWLINKQAPLATELKAIIDQGLNALYESGQAEKMLSTYLD